MMPTTSHFAAGVLRRKRRRGRSAPRPGRVAVPSARERQDFFIDDVTPAAAIAMLRSASYGDLAELNALYDDMIEKDGHLFSVSDSRRLALTGLQPEIIPAPESSQIPDELQAQAEATADFCRNRLYRIAGLDDALNHHQGSIDRGLCVSEIEWDSDGDEYRPVAIHPLLPTQVKQDPQTPGRILIVTPDNDQGVPLDEQSPGKFIVTSRYDRNRNPFVAGLFRRVVIFHMYKRWGLRWFGSGLERFGLPILIAEYLDDATDAEKDEILDILENMGSNGVGIIRKGTEFQMHHARMSGDWPHERLIALVNAEFSKIWLGATLTVEQGSVGSHALGQEHQEVKLDRLREDIRRESAMMSQLLGPLVHMEFGPGAWVPCYRRVIEKEADLNIASQWLERVVRTTGVLPTNGWVINEFGLDVPEGVKEGEAVPGPAQTLAPFSDSTREQERRSAALCCGDGGVTPHRALATIAKRRRGAIAKLMPWIFTAVLASRAHTQEVLGAVDGFIADAATVTAARDGLPELIERLPIDDMQELERQFGLAGQLAGRDLAARRIAARGRRANAESRIIHAHADIDFDRLPFVEAIESFRERLRLSPEAFLDLDREARSRAWRVAGVWNLRLLSMIHEELELAIEAGDTARDFRLRIPAMAENRGWLGENPWHSDLVHYQNFAMSHAAGRLRQYDEFGVGAWRFVNTGDSCPICAPEIGKVYALTDTDRFPPLHFWCDCEDEPVFMGELRPGELRISGDQANEALVQQRDGRSGFRFDVRQYGNLEPLSLSSFPPGMHAAIRSFAGRFDWEIAA